MKQQLFISGLSHDLRGITRIDKKTCFVEGALPEELVKIRVKQGRRNFIEAQVSEIIEASEHRVQAPCPIYNQCGGCDFQYCVSEQQLDYKQEVLAGQFSRLAKVEPNAWLQAISSPAWAYRRRARLACKFDKKTARLLMGFRSKQSNEIVPISACPILEPALENKLAPLGEVLNALSDKRSIGHIELVAANTVAVMIRQLQDWSESDQALLKAFAEREAVLVFSQRESRQQPVLIAGSNESVLHYTIGSDAQNISFMPGDFIQANAIVNERLVDAAMQLLDLNGDDRVMELFCGLGNFTLPIASRASRVFAYEGSAALVDRARQNARLNALDNIDYTATDLSKPLDIALVQQQAANKLLLDPPRDGAAEICQQLGRLKQLKRIVYISCNPSTLARDTRHLCSQGFSLSKAGAVDMFPQTHHIEAIALFKR
jgi:23S rRNA (uracil1939-C5)-methyltransferase